MPPVSKDDRRAQILAAAREEFAEKGYHATGIDDIVARVGIARGTFYLYYPDKKAIFGELVDRFSMRLGMAILRVDPFDASRSVGGQIRENIRRVLSVFLEDQMMAKIFIEDALGIDDAFDAKLLGFYDEVGKMFVKSLVDGESLGLVRTGEHRVFAYFAMGGVKELMFHVIKRGWSYEADKLADAVFDLVSRGMLTEKVGA